MVGCVFDEVERLALGGSPADQKRLAPRLSSRVLRRRSGSESALQRLPQDSALGSPPSAGGMFDAAVQVGRDRSVITVVRDVDDMATPNTEYTTVYAPVPDSRKWPFPMAAPGSLSSD